MNAPTNRPDFNEAADALEALDEAAARPRCISLQDQRPLPDNEDDAYEDQCAREEAE